VLTEVNRNAFFLCELIQDMDCFFWHDHQRQKQQGTNSTLGRWKITLSIVPNVRKQGLVIINM
jgi:hypothetical protein